MTFLTRLFGSEASRREQAALAAGFAAFANLRAEDCPYRDGSLRAAWQRGYRRADLLDGSVW